MLVIYLAWFLHSVFLHCTTDTMSLPTCTGTAYLPTPGQVYSLSTMTTNTTMSTMTTKTPTVSGLTNSVQAKPSNINHNQAEPDQEKICQRVEKKPAAAPAQEDEKQKEIQEELFYTLQFRVSIFMLLVLMITG